MSSHQRITVSARETLGMEEVTWEKVRSNVQKINKPLADIIDEFNPSKEYTLLRVRYPYGVLIRDKGTAYFPNSEQNALLKLDDPQLSSIRKLLSYSSSPLGLVLSKSVEVFAETSPPRIIPFKLFYPGVTFGVWEIMDFPEVKLRQNWDWSISAGGRTVFIPGSISDTISFERLQRAYRVKSSKPDTIFDHHHIFAEIAHHSEKKWSCEILFFTKKWVEPHATNSAWLKLKYHWMREAWKQLQYWTNKIAIDFNWESFIAALEKQKIKPKPYLLDTFKHLVSIGCGTIPGFRPIDEDESVLPSQLIQQAFLDDYQLKTLPLIMQPDFLLPDQKHSAVYYSLQYPTLPGMPMNGKDFKSTMKLMRELKKLIDIFQALSKTWPPIKSGYDLIDYIRFNYFHADLDKYEQIDHFDKMIKEDERLSKLEKAYPHKPFPYMSHFFRGSVRVAFKN